MVGDRFGNMAKKKTFVALIVLMAVGQWKGTASDEVRAPVMTNIVPEAYTIQQPGCHIPKVDLFGSTVSQYFYTEPDFHCDNRTSGQPRPALVREYKNFLYFDHAVLPYYGDPQVSCSYQSFERQPSPEDDVKYSPDVRPLSLDAVTKITAETDEFVVVFCKDKGTDQIIYKDYFAFLPPKQATEKRCRDVVGQKKRDRMNIIIIGLDSLSRVQLQRQLPRAYNFLHRNMAAIEMQGYNKVAENTYPNLVTLLTGLSASQLNESCLLENDGKVDTCPLIWKFFHSNGFRTVFVEDAPDVAIFNWGARGFVQPPTDYYLRPFYLQSERNIGFNTIGCGFRCLGSRPSLEFMLGHAYKMAQTFVEENYFGFFWSCSDTHDRFNYPTRDDDMVTDFLSNIKSSGSLNNTVLIVMSDHGPRLVRFVNTTQGQYEKRLPLLTFAFPPWFESKYSLAMANLRDNAQKLTTHFDLHKTLLEFVDLAGLTEANLQKRYASETHQGRSLFLPISADRSCTKASIPTEFCACDSQGLLDGLTNSTN